MQRLLHSWAQHKYWPRYLFYWLFIIRASKVCLSTLWMPPKHRLNTTYSFYFDSSSNTLIERIWSGSNALLSLIFTKSTLGTRPRERERWCMAMMGCFHMQCPPFMYKYTGRGKAGERRAVGWGIQHRKTQAGRVIHGSFLASHHGMMGERESEKRRKRKKSSS